jgi:hypothetical protein
VNAGTSAGDAVARKATIVRAFIVHMLAYAVAFPWAVAAVPLVFQWREAELMQMADEKVAAAAVLKLAAWPTVVALVVPHLLGLPWILSARAGGSRGRALFAVTTGLLILTGVVLAVAGWVGILAR